MRILVVEDDPLLAEGLKTDLERAAFSVTLTGDAAEADFHVREGTCDLVVLDRGLPGVDGITLLQQWRKERLAIPVLILTARNAWHERVEGLRAGADDYLGKPFHTDELLARVAAVMARHGGSTPGAVSVGSWLFDDQRGLLRDRRGLEVGLTGTELRMLRYFLGHRGHVVSKQQLLEHVWPEDVERAGNLVEVYVSRLRDKLGRQMIRTRRGLGYVFAVEQ